MSRYAARKNVFAAKYPSYPHAFDTLAHLSRYYVAFDDIREVAHAYPPLSDAMKARLPQNARRFAYSAKYYAVFDDIREVARVIISYPIFPAYCHLHGNRHDIMTGNDIK